MLNKVDFCALTGVLTNVECKKLFNVSLIVALITFVFNLTFVDQDNLPVETSGTSWHLGSGPHAESSWVGWL